MPQTTASERQRRIFLTGVFDMQNYGDLLFPLIAQFRLRPYGIDVVPVAPTSASPGLQDAIAPIDVPEMFDSKTATDGIVIGGGYIIHAHRMDVLREYQDGGVGEWAGPSLWIGAALAAALRDVPLAWNAPGVPHPIAPSQRALTDAALAASSYVSLRDRGGAQLLAAPLTTPVALVPDPIAELARMWPRQELESPFRSLLARKNCSAETGFIVVHFRNRSLAGHKTDEAAAMLARFAIAQGVTPIIAAVGRAHDDDLLARAISASLEIPHILLDDAANLKEVAAAIAFSRFYLGASLHGYVTAAAYGVPGVLVARPAYRKFGGFLEHTGRMDDLARDWPQAYDSARARMGESIAQRVPDAVFTALDEHWRRIRAALDAPSAGAEGRRRFLSAFVRFGLKEAGPRWAMQPLMGRAARFVANNDMDRSIG